MSLLSLCSFLNDFVHVFKILSQSLLLKEKMEAVHSDLIKVTEKQGYSRRIRQCGRHRYTYF